MAQVQVMGTIEGAGRDLGVLSRTAELIRAIVFERMNAAYATGFQLCRLSVRVERIINIRAMIATQVCSVFHAIDRVLRRRVSTSSDEQRSCLMALLSRH